MDELKEVLIKLLLDYYEHGKNLDTIAIDADIKPILEYRDKIVSRVELPVILQGELLPCPFCGNKKVKIIEYEALGLWRCIQCNKCKGQFYFFNKGVNIGVGRGTTQQRKERIIEAWNKRAGREPQSK